MPRGFKAANEPLQNFKFYVSELDTNRYSWDSKMSFTASDGTVFQDRREFRRYEFELSYTFRNRGGLTDARLELRKDAPSISGQPFELEKLHSCDVLLLDHTEAIQADELENCRFVIRFAVALLVGCNHISLTFWISCSALTQGADRRLLRLCVRAQLHWVHIYDCMQAATNPGLRWVHFLPALQHRAGD